MGLSLPAGSVLRAQSLQHTPFSQTQGKRNCPRAAQGWPLPAACLTATPCLRQVALRQKLVILVVQKWFNSGALYHAKINKPKEDEGYRLTRQALFSHVGLWELYLKCKPSSPGSRLPLPGQEIYQRLNTYPFHSPMLCPAQRRGCCEHPTCQVSALRQIQKPFMAGSHLCGFML